MTAKHIENLPAAGALDGSEKVHVLKGAGNNSRQSTTGDIAALAVGGAANAELIRDTMGVALQGGLLITVTPNDGADTITIAVDNEALQDAIAAFLTATSPIVETYDDAGNSEGFALDRTALKPTESFKVACSDETTALAAGTGKVTFRMPYAFTVAEVRAELATGQTSGTTLKVDVNEAGVSILGANKLTFDNGQKSTGTAAQSGITITTVSSVADASLADNAEMTVDIDAIGDGTAKGLKITLIGYRT
jgi:hypothetical protein